MTIFQAIFLGFLQGVAEFLPISSSGHLALAKKILGLSEVPLLFDIFLHIATLFAVCIFFRKTIFRLFVILWNFFREIFSKDKNRQSNFCEKNLSEVSFALAGTDQNGRKTILALLITTAVTGAIGIFFSRFVENLPLKFICAGFLLTAFLLIFSTIFLRKSKFEQKPISPLQAIFVGFAQGLGTLPGVSRSGSTISGAIFCGIDRRSAGDYSFIVSIPAILGAFLLELKDFSALTNTTGILQIILGFFAAFFSGYIALFVFMKIVRRGALAWFSVYLIPLGILGIIFF